MRSPFTLNLCMKFEYEHRRAATDSSTRVVFPICSSLPLDLVTTKSPAERSLSLAFGSPTRFLIAGLTMHQLPSAVCSVDRNTIVPLPSSGSSPHTPPWLSSSARPSFKVSHPAGISPIHSTPESLYASYCSMLSCLRLQIACSMIVANAALAFGAHRVPNALRAMQRVEWASFRFSTHRMLN